MESTHRENRKPAGWLVVLCLGVVVVLCSCVPTPALNTLPALEDQQRGAWVTCIRDRTYFAGMPAYAPTYWLLAVNDRNVARLEMGQNVRLQLPAGGIQHIAVRRWDLWWQQERLALPLEPGNEYYLLVGVAGPGQVKIERIPAVEAAGWLAGSQPVAAAQ